MNAHQDALGGELAQALQEEGMGWQRPGPLLAGLLLFALTAVWWRGHAAWALSLGLWAGHALTDGLCGLVAGRRRFTLLLLPPAWLTGALLGWALEQALSAAPMESAQRLTRLWLHLGFGAVLLTLPLLQGLRRVRAVRRVEQERARLRAELQRLQAQIEPHFLFNTLATLRSLVRQGSPQALPLLDAISGMLEATLERVRQQQDSTLGQECELVQHYLTVMALRLGARLRYGLDVDPALRDLPLPPLMLQPLVENALQHGIEPCETGGELRLTARQAHGQLRLSVLNSGLPLDTVSAGGHGLALANLRQRLLALHGDRAGLQLCTNAEGLTEATLTLPLP